MHRVHNHQNLCIGGGVGLHWVAGDSDDYDSNFKKSGPTLNLQGGVVLFRTYDINVLARLQYIHILNTNSDHGLVCDVTIERKPNPKKEEKGIIGKVITSVGYFYLGLFAILLLAG